MGRFNPTRGPWGRQKAARVAESHRHWNGARVCGGSGSGVRVSVLGLRHQRSNVCLSDDCCRPVCQPKANCTLAAIRLAAQDAMSIAAGQERPPSGFPGPTRTEHAYLISWTCCEYAIKGIGSGASSWLMHWVPGEANCQLGS